MRKLVSIRKILAINPIPDADQIQVAIIDGWRVVVRKDEGINVGDDVIYLEVDSLVPSDDERFSFLEKTKFRVRTIKLRKQISQGVIIPINKLTQNELERVEAGESLQEVLRIKKYEPPMPVGGTQKGTFPLHLVPKTDQERVQNIPDSLQGRNSGEFEVTEKLDGTSCTIWFYNDGSVCLDQEEDSSQIEVIKDALVGVASRNYEMKKDDTSVYAKILRQTGLVDKLCDLRRNIAIQGEIVGPAVQGNKYKLSEQKFYVFDVYDIDKKKYLSPGERTELVGRLGLNHVPVHKPHVGTMNLPLLLAMADGPSALHNTDREGLVYKAYDGSLSFKVISNKWLLRNE